MAFNVATFKTRALSAVVFVVIMMAGLLWSKLSFFLLFSIIHFGCWHEYVQLIAKTDPQYGNISSFHKYGAMLAGWSLMLYFTDDSFAIGGITLHAIGWWTGLILLFALPVMEILTARSLSAKNIGYTLLGLLYISLSWALLIDLRNAFQFENEQEWWNKAICIGLIFSIWINDTMAYIVGSLIGKTPFSKISPKKTWEGTAGGALLCIVVIALLGWQLKIFTVTHWAIIAAIAAVTGTLGDLLESKLKRMAGVKDSGNMMPGHGGFLDRFDSLLLATPFVWCYVNFFMK
jgi:phosphatidate cytidylyltransferase